MITVKRYIPGHAFYGEDEERQPVELNFPLEILKVPFVTKYYSNGEVLTVKKYPEGSTIYLNAKSASSPESRIVGIITNAELSDFSGIIPIEPLTFEECAERHVVTPMTISVLDDAGRSGLIFLFLQQQWDKDDKKFTEVLDVLKEVISDSLSYEGYEIVNIFDLEVNLKTGSKYQLQVSATVQGIKKMHCLEFQQRVTVDFLKG